MPTDSEACGATFERLSALVDGELDGTPVVQACAQWRDSAESRATWHAYHLIGDVLRSDDLAADPARDADFLQAFRARLAGEPVVLAPRPLEAPAPVSQAAAARAAGGVRSRTRAWMTPTAVAAGFAMVAGALVLTRAPVSLPERQAAAGVVVGAGQLVSSAATAPMATSLVPAGATTAGSEPQTFVATDQLIRDARLDRYLAAHKQFAGSSALGVPSAFLRNATAEVAGR